MSWACRSRRLNVTYVVSNNIQAEFFEPVLRTIAEKDPRRILVIGDSLSSHIAGGQAAGLDTCWVNRKHQSMTLKEKPTWQINDLCQLMEIMDE